MVGTLAVAMRVTVGREMSRSQAGPSACGQDPVRLLHLEWLECRQEADGQG